MPVITPVRAASPQRPRAQDRSGPGVATVTDVARHAGVSLATVSRVLNGHTSVSSEMRERVQTAVRALSFHPNTMAQGLRRGTANTVALLVGDIAQLHFGQLTMQLQAALEEQGMDLLLFNLGHSQHRLSEFLERAMGMRLRGLVLTLSDTIPRSAGPLFERLVQQGLQVVCIGQDLTRHGIPCVVHEERAATQRSVQHLLARGHRRIAYVGRIKGSAVGTERYRGYRAALEHAGAYDEALVWDVAYRYRAGREAVNAALDRGLAFTALQAGSDEMAMGALSALTDRGLRVPDEVAIIGFGDVEMGSYLRPALSTLSSHPEEAARHVSALFAPGRSAPRTASLTLLRRELVMRESG